MAKIYIRCGSPFGHKLPATKTIVVFFFCQLFEIIRSIPLIFRKKNLANIRYIWNVTYGNTIDYTSNIGGCRKQGRQNG